MEKSEGSPNGGPFAYIKITQFLIALLFPISARIWLYHENQIWLSLAPQFAVIPIVPMLLLVCRELRKGSAHVLQE